MSRENEGIFKAGIALIFFGGTFFVSGLRRHRQLKAVEDTPSSDIRSAAQGLVEFQGHALPYERAYVSSDGRSTVYRDLKIQKYVRRGKNSSWETIHQETEGNQFVLSDGTGLALVHLNDAEFVLNETKTAWKAFPGEVQSDLVQRYGGVVSGLRPGGGGFFSFGGEEFRFLEKNIRVGSPVYLRGSFSTTAGLAPYVIEPVHLQFLGKLASLRKETGGKAKAFDLNRDGKIEEHEVARGSEKMLYQAKSGVQSGDQPEPVAFQGMLRSDSNHGLLIADCHQEHLNRKLGSFVLLRIFGGIAMIAVGVGVLAGLT